MSRTPTTHISSLANLHKTFCIQMVNPWVLIDSIDCSTDLHSGAVINRTELLELLSRKGENCSEWFEDNLGELGIQTPLVVIVRSDGKWQFDDGHHRLSWALRRALLLPTTLIPVIFDDTGADQDSTLCYLVHQASDERFHDTIAEDLIDTGTILMVEEVETYLAVESTKTIVAEIPPPRAETQTSGRHRSGGKHRKQ